MNKDFNSSLIVFNRSILSIKGDFYSFIKWFLGENP